MTGIAAATAPIVNIDIVICTYNRAANLDEVLSALSAQRVGSDVIWSVLVVDNASTDATAEVVEAHRFHRLLPSLRRVVESEQGLTPARRRGVQETTAPWIAFVDDDNLLAPGWVDAIAQAIRSHPEAGGISGRVVLDWEEPPPNFLKGLGSCFAEQELGEAAREIDDMVGVGGPSSNAVGWNARCSPIASANALSPAATARSCNVFWEQAFNCGLHRMRCCGIASPEAEQAGIICSASCMAWVEAKRG